MKIGGNDAGVARGVKVDRFGEIVSSGQNINYLQSINVSLPAGESQEYYIQRPNSNFIGLFLTQSTGNKISVKLRHKLPNSVGFGSTNYIEEHVLNQIQFRQLMSDWHELKTTDTSIVVTNNGTTTSNSQISVFGKRKETGIEYKPKTKILSRVEFTSWSKENYMFVGKDIVTTGYFNIDQYLDFTNIKDVKIIIESTLSGDVKMGSIRTHHQNYGEVFRTVFSDYFEEDLLTIRKGEVFQFGTRESRALSDVDVFDDLFTDRTRLVLDTVGSEIPTGSIKITILGREY